MKSKLIGTLVMAGLIISCSDFLDQKPVSNGIAVSNTDSDSLVYKTAGDLETGLSGVYADFKNEYFMLDYYVNGDAQGDDAYAGADNPANFQIDKYTIDATNTNVSRDWADLYATIGKANLVIDNATRSTDASLTVDERKRIIGESSFIRAFMYFQLVQLFDGVPLQLEAVTSFDPTKAAELFPVVFPPRATEAEVYAQIIADLENALASVAATGPDKGYATTGAVNAILARVYATREPHDWAKVKSYTDAVIAGGYTLLPQYDNLWDNTIENSSESIFEINCYGWDTGGNWGASMFAGTDWKKFDIPSNDLVNAFDAEGDDIRKNSSIAFMDVTGSWTDPQWPSNQYPFINKWRDFSGAQNFILIRLADVLLLKAEAENELGNTAAAADLVNQIRTRVSLANTTANDQGSMRTAIAKERRLELAFEGVRWYDLKRTGQAIDVINAVKGENGSDLGYALTSQRLLWPIPQTERDKNKQLTQNDGY
jgi:hypothetical protein